MKKKIIISISLCVFLFLIYRYGNMFSGGSYAYAEIYELPIAENELVKIISQFKDENPQFKLPDNIPLPEGKDSSEYWYHIYFFYQDKNQVISTWTRQINKSKTQFAFVGINYGKELGHWKQVNHDFGFFENRKIKEEFENRIYNLIKKKVVVISKFK